MFHVYVPCLFFILCMYSVRNHFRCERCDICVDLYMIYNYLSRMALLDRIRGWFYYVFIRGKDKRSEGDLSMLSIIEDIRIRSSSKHSCLLTVTTFLPARALKGSLYSETLTLITKINTKFAVVHHVVYSLWVG